MKRFFQVIISIVYIIWGIGAPLTLVGNLATLNISALTDLAVLVSIATGLVMFFAGIFGLFHIKPLKRRILGVIIFILAASSVITSLVGGQIAWQSILQAAMAFLYMIA